MLCHRLAVLLLAAAVGACTTHPPQAPLQPEGASGYRDNPGWASGLFSVATANPLASEAGYHVLRAGGNAIDAAIAVQMVLALVEPQSSGIGGGAFMLHFDGTSVQAYDGRETAPTAATPNLFLQPDGKPMGFIEAVVGGRSVGAPGTVRMLEQAHRQHGKLPWATLFSPAIRLAEQGFPVSARLHTLLSEEEHLKQDPDAAAYFFNPQGQPWAVGHRLKNPAFAKQLRELAAHGANALHTGPTAQAIVNKIRSHPRNPGVMTEEDLAGYQPRQREALCFAHRVPPRNYRICGFPPPSSGAITVGQILGLMQHTPAAALPLDPQGLPDADWLHYYTEASRLAFADRALYIADPDFVEPPAGSWSSLLAPAYLHQRAEQIGPRPMTQVRAGQPSGAARSFAPMATQPEYGTTHLSIIDADGNAVAMTSSIEYVFGSKLMVNGFLLNNQSTDFSFVPYDANGQAVANRVQPNKRARSSMSPMMVFNADTGEPVLIGGSAGGSLIIHHMAKMLWGILHWGLNVQQAISLPNFGPLQGMSLLEEGRFPPATIEALRTRGQPVRETPLTSGLHAIERSQTGYFGGADPRREGLVLGD